MISTPTVPSNPGMNRNLMVAGSVVVFHAVLLWALQTGLLRRAVEVVVPVQILSEFISPPAPQAAPQPPAPRQPMVRQRQAVTPAPVVQQPQAVADPTPAPAPLVAPTAPAAPAMAVAAAPAAPPAPAAPARVELPSSDADYLNNPKPPYPPLSRRLGEQGKVVVRVLIGVDGSPQKAEVRNSSGYERLDQAALATVLRWRYVPGKRGGVPEAMWFNVPINFVLE